MGVQRKIVHIDMDAFYASVEQRDNPQLRGKPVVVGGSPQGRGVVAACSYEARAFGIHSAMPARQALTLCPHTIFLSPRFQVYQAVSKQIQAVFYQFTELVEPLSLDEAYLDVTASDRLSGSASLIAREIKKRVLDSTGLVASAGVSYNKFLAKIASDMDKPDGIYTVLPGQGEDFVARLPIGKFYGVGAVTESKMIELGINTGADLKMWKLDELESHFGKAANYYYQIARGIDNRPVCAERTRKSIGSETTFSQNLVERSSMLNALDKLVEDVVVSLDKHGLLAATLTMKLRYADFTTVSRSVTLPDPVGDCQSIRTIIPYLLDRALVDGGEVRLLGISLSGLQSRDARPRQLGLFGQ